MITYALGILPSDCPWLDENPESGSVPPGDHDPISVSINTVGLTPGDYSAEIVIVNNDPDEDPTIVPVTLTVMPWSPPPVGGTIVPTDKLGLVTPWIVAAALIVVAAVSLAMWNKKQRASRQ